MKESDKNIENLIEKMMSEDTLQSPSMDFTSNIMSQILVAEKVQPKVYQPLISKSVWFFVFVVMIGLVVYANFFSGTEYNLEIGKSYSDKIAGAFSRIHFSKNTLYAIMIVPVMVLIQITLLKNYFDKKYEL